MQVWATDEFGYADIPEEYCTTSSILPQKKNPIGLQIIRGTAAVSSGALTAALQATAHAGDTVIFDREMIAAEMWRALDVAEQGGRILAGLVDGVVFDRSEMRRRAERSWSIAYDVAVAFVRHGLNWRQAHEASAKIVRDAIDAGLTPGAVDVAFINGSLGSIDVANAGLVADLLLAFDPKRSVEAKRVAGGPRPEDVRAQVRQLRAELGELTAEADKTRERDRQGAAKLERAIDNILQRAGRDARDVISEHGPE